MKLEDDLRDALMDAGLWELSNVSTSKFDGKRSLTSTGSGTVNVAKLTAAAKRFGLEGLTLTFEPTEVGDYGYDGYVNTASAAVELRWTEANAEPELPTGLEGATWERYGERGKRAALRLPNRSLLVPEDFVAIR